MATAKFRALSREDIRGLGTVVQSSSSVDSYTILDNELIPGDYASSIAEQSLQSYHVRKVIALCTPTFNNVLGRSGCKLLQKLLNFDDASWKNIVECNVVFDTQTKELVNINEAMPGRNYLYTAEIAEYFIDALDVDAELLRCLYTALGDFVRAGTVVKDYFTIDKNSNGEWLVADYYLHYDPIEVKEALKRGRTLDSIKENYLEILFSGQDSRFSYLYNMARNKSGLYGMLNYFIVVLPMGMRPSLDGREHKLTKHYTSVIKANSELKSAKASSTSPKDLRTKYLSLEKQVSKLQYKNQGTAPDVKPDDLAVLERIKSKKGQIRINNLGKRQDYSGRAVVCINPYLPLDVIRIPRYMIPKLFEYHALPYLAQELRKNSYESKMGNHSQNVLDSISLTRLKTPEAQAEILRIIEEHKIAEKVPVVMGRQPTLHKQSLQGFHIEISDLNAIEVNPTVCPAFNMDFDGDQAHLEVPLSPKAIKEVNDLVLTTQNLFLSKTGECTTEPRQDMLYGLYTCTRDDYVLNAKKYDGLPFDDLEAVRQAVLKHQVKVDETVHVMSQGIDTLAGDAAFMACFGEGEILPRGKASNDKPSVVQVDKHTITSFIEYLLRTNTDGTFKRKIGTGYASTSTFVGAVNALVETGFKVARLYPTNMSLIHEAIPIPEYDNAIDKFHNDMSYVDLLYNIGLETSDNYKIEFDKHLDVLSKAKSGNIIKKLGKENGYAKLSVSGARGSIDNLAQAFSYKGRVKKNSNESFDALLENSYASQLTPMEHFVAAYGGRQGQIDKSLKTGDTGYAMRKMWHADQGMMITTKDCGTSRGIVIDKSKLAVFIDSDDEDTIAKEAEAMFEHAIVGRYRVGDNKIISKAEAKEWARDTKTTSITIRSPLTCNNPCCQKCYGIDWSTHKLAVVGLPIGIIAAQSIGEPGTQLTLKQFQKGGVAGKAEVTSAFDKVNKYVSVANLADASKDGKYPGYDPLAWATGKVIEKPASDITQKIVRIDGAGNKSIVIPKDVVLKEFATKGEGLSYRHGDYSLHEIIAYSGIEAAQFYLVFKLFNLYKSEVKIKLAHFETLVADMTRYMITATDRKDIMVGQYCTSRELYAGSLAKTKYIPRLINIQKLTNASCDAIDAIAMESQGEGLSRICLLGMEDSLTKPINRLILGQTIINGSAVPGFIENRKEII